MLDLNAAQYAALSRQDFHTFMRRCFAELYPGQPFYPNWHIELIAAKLAAVRAGRIRRLIINVPPRSLKSLLGSVALPAWCLGHDPSAQIICASYAQDLAEKLSRECRAVMASSWYQALFPRTQLSRQKQAAGEFETTARGFRLATSVGGVLTGRGAELLIIDDPLKPEEAFSEAQRRAANGWFDGTLLSRLNDKRTGRIVVIMQRLHEDDLTGHLLAKGGWEVLRLPAIAEDDEEHAIADVLRGAWRARRRAGEALHPGREPVEVLATLRRDMGEYAFAGQYQQAPAPAEGGLIKRAWLRFDAASGVPTSFDAVVQSWDTANKATELSDYSVCTTWGCRDGHFFLLDVRRERLDYPSLKRAVRAMAERHRPDTILIEDKASGTQLIQELTHEGLSAVRGFLPSGDKLMRLHAQSVRFENGFVHLPESAPWLADYVHELTLFPHAKHDDQVDSTSQALEWASTHAREPALLTYYKRRSAAAGL